MNVRETKMFLSCRIERDSKNKNDAIFNNKTNFIFRRISENAVKRDHHDE